MDPRNKSHCELRYTTEYCSSLETQKVSMCKLRDHSQLWAEIDKLSWSSEKQVSCKLGTKEHRNKGWGAHIRESSGWHCTAHGAQGLQDSGSSGTSVGSSSDNRLGWTTGQIFKLSEIGQLKQKGTGHSELHWKSEDYKHGRRLGAHTTNYLAEGKSRLMDLFRCVWVPATPCPDHPYCRGDLGLPHHSH